MAGSNWGSGMNINLHIDRLVLDGISIQHDQRAGLKTTIENELERLLLSNGIDSGMQSSKSVHAVTGSSIFIEKPDPLKTGQQIAGSVYRGIGK